MSVSKLVTVWCDGCGGWEHTGHNAKEARQHARRAGWHVSLPGTAECQPGHDESLHWPGKPRDLCPRCWREGKR